MVVGGVIWSEGLIRNNIATLARLLVDESLSDLC